MKKFLIIIFLIINCFSGFSLSLDYVTRKSSFEYNKADVINVMKKYHAKYGKSYVDYEATYYTVKYWARYFDVDFMFALSIFAIESGFTYECESPYHAIGMGQVVQTAINDFNGWYGKHESFSDLKQRKYYDRNIMVSLGYLRMCYDKYNVIENGSDLVQSYNIGVGNLAKIKNGEYDSDNEWTVAGKRYEEKFVEAYADFTNCRR